MALGGPVKCLKLSPILDCGILHVWSCSLVFLFELFLDHYQLVHVFSIKMSTILCPIPVSHVWNRHSWKLWFLPSFSEFFIFLCPESIWKIKNPHVWNRSSCEQFQNIELLRLQWAQTTLPAIKWFKITNCFCEGGEDLKILCRSRLMKKKRTITVREL